jgi:hypothetical protein
MLIRTSHPSGSILEKFQDLASPEAPKNLRFQTMSTLFEQTYGLPSFTMVSNPLLAHGLGVSDKKTSIISCE